MSITAKTINLVFSRDASTSKRAPLASFLSLFASDKTFLILMLCSVFTLYKSSTGQVLVPLCFTLNISHSYAVFRFHTAQELHQLVSCFSLLIQIKHLSFLCCVPFSRCTTQKQSGLGLCRYSEPVWTESVSTIPLFPKPTHFISKINIYFLSTSKRHALFQDQPGITLYFTKIALHGTLFCQL